MLPSWLASCKREDFFPDRVNYKGQVYIVGAGAAGMYAAYLLMRRGIKVNILEASSVYGGRIRTSKTLTDFPVELGAEEVHGNKSVFFDLVRSTNATFTNDVGSNYYFLDTKLRSEAELKNYPQYTLMERIIDDIAEYGGQDIDLTFYGQEKGLPQIMQPLFNALLGNEYGASNSRIGVLGIKEAERLFSAGTENFMLRNRSILSVFEEVMGAVIPKIQFNKQVRAIDYTNREQIKITDNNGQEYTANKLIITVPLPVLRDNDITFTPALPQAKQSAVANIGMGAGMKIVMLFSYPFWPPDAQSIYGKGYIPEFWVTSGGGRSISSFALTAFVHGEKAEFLSAQGPAAINTVLQELDTMFGNNIASATLLNYEVMDWFKEPFIRGTYSFPLYGQPGTSDRMQLATAIENRIFFAGEATHFGGHFGTVHGAMETGMRAAYELLSAVT